jgi:hypothetical protein
MAKALKSEAAAPEAGSAPQIPNRNEEAVFLSHLNKLRIQSAKAAIKKAEYDAERNVLTDMFREAKTDGFTRKELVSILTDGAASRRDLTAEEQRRAQLREWAGLPAGTQTDLFATPSLAQDEVFAEGQGYTAGLRGDDSTMPDNFPPHHAPAFLRGYHAGQERLAWAMSGAGHNPEKAASGLKLVANDEAAATSDAA